jgi:hypothetical protein
MRTTLTLDPDVAECLQREIRRTGKGMKAVVNDALRSGLAPSPRAQQPPRFKAEARPPGSKRGHARHRPARPIAEREPASSHPFEILSATGFIGSGRGPGDLSIRYKEELRKILAEKSV